MRTPEEILAEPSQLDPRYVTAGMFNGPTVIAALTTMQRETIEACAKVADEHATWASSKPDRGWIEQRNINAKRIAAAIRDLAAGEAQHG